MESNLKNTPNEVLGGQIVEALIAEGLLSKDSVKDFKRNFVAGRTKESDWKIELEAGLKKEENGK